jgi:hypothetical protein
MKQRANPDVPPELEPFIEALARLLVAAPESAREAMRALMPAEHPILLTPESDGGYLLRGATKLGALLFGDAAGSASVASPRGTALFAASRRNGVRDAN